MARKHPEQASATVTPLKWFVVGLIVAALAATTAIVIHQTHDPILIGYWSFCASILCFCVISVLDGRTFTHLPPAPGRVLAIIPCYNEEQSAVDATVWSLINQTRAVDEIHVIDDGSAVPVTPFDHPRVFWHRQANTGKRGAHVAVLKMFDRADFDYVLTVDSDSTPYPDALDQLLRSMSDPKVQAATGMIYVRNFRDSIVARAADMDIGMSCVMMRASRTMLGALETTSGALALYRSSLLYDHLAGYAIECGTGDDRWLALRGLLRGDVVAVAAAGVETDMPVTIKGTYRQRIRWARSWWWMLPFVFTNLSVRKLLSPAYGLTQLVIAPLFMTFILVSYLMYGQQHHLNVYMFAYVLCYIMVRGGVAALYLIRRPNVAGRDVLHSWLIGTPASIVLNLFLLTPLRYYALFRLRDNRWQTREAKGARERNRRMHLKTVLAFTALIVAVLTGVTALVGSSSSRDTAHNANSTTTTTASGSISVLPPPPKGVPVLSNNCSNGYITFTFDDGPSTHTVALLSELKAENVPAVFFVIGYNAVDHPDIIRAEIQNGFLVEDHTWDHPSLIGPSNKAHPAPLTDAEIRAEFVKDNNAIVAAGAPQPTMYRPPYGNTDAHVTAIAKSLGMRLVESWSVNGTITDDGDWTGASPATIYRNVTQGWHQGKLSPNVGIHPPSIIAGHDGLPESTNIIAAMPKIVSYMNAHHLCATSSVPATATGGVLGNSSANKGGG